jgi:uncharacterized Zn-finger protein
MIYVAITGADDKLKQYTCDTSVKPIKCKSKKNNFYKLPKEYLEIQEQCEKMVNEIDCNSINDYSKKISNSILCEWEKQKCTKSSSLIPSFLIPGKVTLLGYEDNEDEDEIFSEPIPGSIEKIYDIYGQNDLYATKFLPLKK